MHTAFLPPLALPFLLLGLPASDLELEPLERLIGEGAVKISAKSLGGHSAGCIAVELVNRTGRPLRTTIPAGWLMQSSDPEAQDLMIVDRPVVELAPNASRTVTCAAYCVESADRSPEEGSAFTSVGLARPTWVKLADHLVANTYPEGIMQDAVWAVANDHDIAGIGAQDVKASQSLRQFVADLTGRKVPWYAKQYAAPTEEGRVFSDAATTVHGEIDFRMNTHGVVTVLVHDASGHLMHIIGKDRHLGPGDYSMEVDLTVQGWPKGDYTVQFFLDGSNLIRRLPFQV